MSTYWQLYASGNKSGGQEGQVTIVRVGMQIGTKDHHYLGKYWVSKAKHGPGGSINVAINSNQIVQVDPFLCGFANIILNSKKNDNEALTTKTSLPIYCR